MLKEVLVLFRSSSPAVGMCWLSRMQLRKMSRGLGGPMSSSSSRNASNCHTKIEGSRSMSDAKMNHQRAMILWQNKDVKICDMMVM